MKHFTPNDKGRPLGVEEIQALLATIKKGAPPSRWWITHNFAPEHKRKLGRTCWWWEGDVYAWLNAQ